MLWVDKKLMWQIMLHMDGTLNLCTSSCSKDVHCNCVLLLLLLNPLHLCLPKAVYHPCQLVHHKLSAHTVCTTHTHTHTHTHTFCCEYTPIRKPMSIVFLVCFFFRPERKEPSTITVCSSSIRHK
jgi:hypothetical protein